MIIIAGYALTSVYVDLGPQGGHLFRNDGSHPVDLIIAGDEVEVIQIAPGVEYDAGEDTPASTSFFARAKDAHEGSATLVRGIAGDD